MLDIALLGTAALAPIPGRPLSAATLTCGGRTVLFDCGEGTQTAARDAGVSLMKADVIALTHYHGDHIFGLPGLLQTLNSQNRADPLYITGPRGLEAAMAPILDLAGPLCYEVRPIPLPPEGMALRELNALWPGEARLTAFATRHRVPSQGYVFTLGRAGKFRPEQARELGVPVPCWRTLQAGQAVRIGDITVKPEQVMGPPRRGLKMVFSGDTVRCDALVQASKQADLLICDGTYGENDQAQLAGEYGHMTFAQAARTAAEAGARRLWLTHFSQRMERPEEYLSNARSLFEAAECGAPGMRIELGFE